jgi:hypothetical protein
MSIIRNRELSQFGSFIYIDNNSQEIGIATNTLPYVGIGTTNPTVKFHVVGDTNLQGNVTVINGTLDAASYTLNGTPLVNAALSAWDFGTGAEIYRLNGNVGIGISNVSEKLTVNGNVSAGQFISTVTTGTAPLVVQSNTQVTNLNASFLRGKVPPSGDIVGTTDTQTLSNKTLISPVISSGGLNVTGGIGVTGGITLYGSTSGSTLLQASVVASGTLTLPAATDTLIARNTTDTLTNKIIAAGSNTITGITSSNLSASAGILNAQLANSTISGISLGTSLNSLTFGSYLTSTGSYNGSTARTVSIAGTSINTANTIVARDINGDFIAGSINCSYLNASFDINSNSDQNLKKNIETVKNPLEIVAQLRGVTFDWKETGKSSIGVIAQELEKVLPQIVNNSEVKSVNYNGIIGVLIEAVKELSVEVLELKAQLNN